MPAKKPSVDRQIVWRNVVDLVPYARNARTHTDEQVAQIAASIREFGFTNPILTDDENGVVAGHGRLLAARKLGLDQVPTLPLSGLSKGQLRAYVLADNKLAENAGWDREMLALELGELRDDGFDVGLIGFSEDEIDGLLAEAGATSEGQTDPDDVPEPLPEPVTKRGDLWLCGRHRVLCGDCRDFADVERLCNGARVNVAFTSPPYASQRKYDESSGFKPIAPDAYVEWFADVQANVRSVLADDGSWFVNIKEHCEDGQRHLYVKDLTIAHVRQWGWRFVDELCWTHGGLPGQWPDKFKNGFEPVFHFATGTIKFRPTNVGHESDDCFKGNKYGERVGVYGKRDNKIGWSGNDVVGHEGVALPSNVIHEHNNPASRQGTGGHGATFPIALPSFFISAFSDADDVIFDPFMGSGTTLIAAEKLGRIGIGTEISPMYCDVIVRRWQAFTGQSATLDGDGRTFDAVAAERKAA